MSMYVDRAKGFLGAPRGAVPMPPWLTEADIDVFAAEYTRTGFRGGLNWYRNIDRNWELTAPWQAAKIMQPALFIAGTHDAVITGSMDSARSTKWTAWCRTCSARSCSTAPATGSSRSARGSECRADRICARASCLRRMN